LDALDALRRNLLTWGGTHWRHFPWRETADPYAIFVAEVLLHRTRAEQVVPLYLALLTKCPTVGSLATADRAVIHELLRSGGLRWRVDTLLEASRQVTTRFSGSIPQSRSELESLPGVGHYIATAIRCFAYGEPDAVVDTNTVRVVARVYNLEIHDGLRRSKHFRNVIEGLLDRERPRDFNFALLDLAALVCTPKEPECRKCPILEFCEYGRERIGGKAS
jgi:A/G-specific adenine glycosylase